MGQQRKICRIFLLECRQIEISYFLAFQGHTNFVISKKYSYFHLKTL